MDNEIEFGQIQQQVLQSGVRPDQDARFTVAEVGTVSKEELPIFVDLDAMRDMTAHACSDKTIELGGVMLGRAMRDDRGQPFVVVSDSLPAVHYEATRCSFKFTHDTWTQIARQRDRRKPDLNIVGWYHTHPGFTVFLSPMDVFICENFFSFPQDVALVIDPCNETAGWFHWRQTEDGGKPSMSLSGSCRLFTDRLRRDELKPLCRLHLPNTNGQVMQNEGSTGQANMTEG